MDQFLNRYHSKFSRFTDWIYVLVILNILALLFTLLGLVVFGFFPALMTTYQLIRKKIDQEEFPLFKTFYKTYKGYFLKANQVGLLLILIWVVVYLSWTFYLQDLETTLHFVGLIVVGFIALCAFFVTTYLPISFVYFPRFKVLEHFKFSILMALGIPKVTFLIGLNTLFFYFFIFIRFVTVFPFLAFSLPAFINLLVARKKLLGIFTVFKDEHITCLSLNAYDHYLDMWTLYQDHMATIYPITYDAYLEKTVDAPLLNKRLSVVILDKEEQLIGYQWVLTDDMGVHVQWMWIHENYRRRGYGKRIMRHLESRSYALGYETIQFGHPQSYFDDVPRVFAKHLPFLKKLGYQIDQSDDGYQVKKSIEEKTK